MTPTTQGAVGPGKIQRIAMLAGLLESVERGMQQVDAENYRRLVTQLRELLSDVMPDDMLRQLFAASPAAAEIYENLHYQHAGLCLRPIDAAARAEQAARRAIERARTEKPAAGA